MWLTYDERYGSLPAGRSRLSGPGVVARKECLSLVLTYFVDTTHEAWALVGIRTYVPSPARVKFVSAFQRPTTVSSTDNNLFDTVSKIHFDHLQL